LCFPSNRRDPASCFLMDTTVCERKTFAAAERASLDRHDV
jgi:hypothetical protein